jgi:hypothetical protein
LINRSLRKYYISVLLSYVQENKKERKGRRKEEKERRREEERKTIPI